MAFYNDMAQMVADLLQPDTAGGLGQGEIEISRLTMIDDNNPWGGSVYKTERIKGAAKGIAQSLVGTEAGGTVLLATDKQVVCEVPEMDFESGDILSLGGRQVHIITHERIPAVGTTCAIKFIVRG